MWDIGLNKGSMFSGELALQRSLRHSGELTADMGVVIFGWWRLICWLDVGMMGRKEEVRAEITQFLGKLRRILCRCYVVVNEYSKYKGR